MMKCSDGSEDSWGHKEMMNSPIQNLTSHFIILIQIWPGFCLPISAPLSTIKNHLRAYDLSFHKADHRRKTKTGLWESWWNLAQAQIHLDWAAPINHAQCGGDMFVTHSGSKLSRLHHYISDKTSWDRTLSCNLHQITKATIMSTKHCIHTSCCCHCYTPTYTRLSRFKLS